MQGKGIENYFNPERAGVGRMGGEEGVPNKTQLC